MFALNGKTFDIKNIVVNFSRDYKSQDMSGMSSMTDDSEQGEKAAELEISGLISFKHLNQLTELEQMSAAKDAAGDREVYRVVNDVANAFKIKMAKFAGKFSITQQESQMAWKVSFRLKEHHSIAEQKEQRHKVKTKPEQRENTLLKEALLKNKELIS